VGTYQDRCYETLVSVRVLSPPKRYNENENIYPTSMLPSEHLQPLCELAIPTMVCMLVRRIYLAIYLGRDLSLLREHRDPMQKEASEETWAGL
jgi:hypothetical protein